MYVAVALSHPTEAASRVKNLLFGARVLAANALELSYQSQVGARFLLRTDSDYQYCHPNVLCLSCRILQVSCDMYVCTCVRIYCLSGLRLVLTCIFGISRSPVVLPLSLCRPKSLFLGQVHQECL